MLTGTLARYGESLARRGLLTQAQQDEMTARYRDWLDSCQKREPQPLKPAIHSFSANWYGLTNHSLERPVSTALPRQSWQRMVKSFLHCHPMWSHILPLNGNWRYAVIWPQVLSQ